MKINAADRAKWLARKDTEPGATSQFSDMITAARKPTPIQRYDPVVWRPGPIQTEMLPDDDGQWVLHSDHLTHVAKLEAQITAGPDKVLRCAFCGEAYPEGTPDHKHESLAAHIRVCAAHPVGVENRALRELLKNAGNMLRSVAGDIEDGYSLSGMREKYALAVLNAADEAHAAAKEVIP